MDSYINNFFQDLWLQENKVGVANEPAFSSDPSPPA